MCGIAGIISLKNKSILFSESEFSEQLERLKHRGPDGIGILCENQFYLGHTRLSIIDLSTNASQPMIDSENQIVITFNGEIYNYKEIRNELINKGHQFKTSSDTEVIIESYKEWGIDCIKKFNGMFAFALFDKCKNETFIVRDRLGIKPLFYTILNDSLLFASEPKGIIYYKGFKRKPNLKAVSNYLSFRCVFGKETLFENVYELEPGNYIHVSNNTFVLKQYWDINLDKKPTLSSKDKTIPKVQQLVKDAVKKCMISDVPVGSLLSGGLDSSIILGVMSETTSRQILSYSVTFDEPGYDETHYSNIVAKKFHSKNQQIKLKPEDYINNIVKYIRYKDQPAGLHNEIAMFLMSKEISKDLKVVLSGEGADELFSGYGRLFRSPYDYRKIHLTKKFPLFFKRTMLRFFGLNSNINQPSNELEHFCDNYTYFPKNEKQNLYNEKMLEETFGDIEISNKINELFKKASKRNYYDKISYVFLKLHLPALLLMLDATTMANGVESRVPFLDHRLVEDSFKIKSSLKLKWKSILDQILSIRKPASVISEKHDITKYILKESFIDFLPEEIIKRTKMPFPVPLNEWFKNDFYSIFSNEVLKNDAMIAHFFDMEKLQKWAFDEKNFTDSNHGRKLWIILNLELWMKEYFN